MAARPAIAVLLLLAAFWSGCAAPPTPPPAVTAPEPSEAEATAPAMLRVEEEVGWLVGLGSPAMPVGQLLVFGNGASLSLPDPAQRLRVYANWTCMSPTCDIHLYVFAPGEGPGQSLTSTVATGHAAGGSPLMVEVPEPVEGEWVASLQPADVDVQVDGTVVIVADGIGAFGATTGGEGST